MHELTRPHLADPVLGVLSYYPRDVSFFLPPTLVEPVDAALEVCRGVKGVGAVSLLDQVELPDGRRSATLRMRLEGFLSANDARELQKSVGARLSEQLGVVIR